MGTQSLQRTPRWSSCGHSLLLLVCKSLPLLPATWLAPELQVSAANTEAPTDPNEPHKCYLMLNNGINFLTSFLEKEYRRLNEKATVLKLIKEMPQTLKAARTRAVRTALIWPCCTSKAFYGQIVFSRGQLDCWVQWVGIVHSLGFASGLNQSCGPSWTVLWISFLTLAGT